MSVARKFVAGSASLITADTSRATNDAEPLNDSANRTLVGDIARR